MRILVTGGSGFLGSHLVELLLAAGHHVTVIDNLSTGCVENLRPEAEFCRYDVSKPITELFRKVRPEVVVHLAAQVSVHKSVEFPADDLTTNAIGTINVVEAAAAVGSRKVVFVSSGAVYGLPESFPTTESHTAQGISPYGISKLTAEHYVRLLGRLHNITFTILRPSNIYGPRQTTEGEGAVVPSFLSRFLMGIDPVIHGDGRQTRDFLYVTDMARAVLAAISRGDGQTLNISHNSSTSVIDIWQTLARHLNWPRPAVFGTPRVGDIGHSQLDNFMAKAALEWQPETSFETGLASTVAWALSRQASSASGSAPVTLQR